MPFTATVAIGYAAPVELELAPAAWVLLLEPPVALRTTEARLELALARADAADEAPELTAALAEEAAPERALEAEAAALLAKMVVLPTVLVMVLPSVVMVVRIGEVVIAAPA